jgi:putative intracellular protease/amidase
VAVICASPVALSAGQFFKGKRLTSHPCVENELAVDYSYQSDRVVVDGKLTVFEFA